MITKEKVDQVVNIIKSTVDPDAIYLFGSFVSGRAKENSDLDVCIVKDKVGNKHEELLKAKKGLFKIGIPLDILLFSSANLHKRKNIWGSVQYEICNKGKKIYEK